MIKLKFEEISIKKTKSGRCNICNKNTSRTEKFYQTLNPFNKTKAGITKTRDQIYEEIFLEANEWMKKPILHKKCEK